LEKYNKGSVVLIKHDLHEAERYEVLKLKDEKAKVKSINPREDVFCIDIDDLEQVKQTKEEVIKEWKRHHDYSGI
jgi:choline kinase